MNFLLKNLELELEESHLVVGEKLLDEGRLTRLFESERHLWVAEVDQFEVEIQISPSRVRAFSCDCNIFRQEKMCGHVAASLLALRHKRTELPEENASPKPKTPAVYQKLTISSILDSVAEEELATFVRHYAQTNRNFALALKTHFASKVPISESREKYIQLLDSALALSKKNDGRISSPAAHQLLKVIKELVGQAEDAFALEHYAECWAILAALLEKIPPVLRKIDAEIEPFRSHLLSVFVKLEQLVSMSIPPALRDEIWQFLQSEFSRPAYRLNDLSAPFLDFLLLLASDAEKAESLLQSIDNELIKHHLTDANRQLLLKTKILLLQKPELAKQADEFTLECLSSDEKMLLVNNTASAHGLLPAIRPLVEKGLRFTYNEEVRTKLEESLLQIAQGHGDQDTIVQLSRKQLLETGDIVFYEKCKMHFEGDWYAFVQQVLAELIQQPRFNRNLKTIATILGREGRFDELLKLLHNQQSLDLVLEFDYFLLKNHREELYTLYDHLLKTYLSNHLGIKAAQQLQKILNHLQQSGASGLVEKLSASIRKAYPRRSLLFEELEVN